MRAIALFVAVISLQLYAESRPVPPKVRTEAEKIDARVGLLKQSYQSNFEKSVELKNRVATLRERATQAKNPANRERFETALAHAETEYAALEEKLTAQRKEIADLKTKRTTLTAGIIAKEDAPKPEREGKVEHLGDFGTLTAQNDAAREWKEKRDENMKKIAAAPPRPGKNPPMALRVIGALGIWLLTGALQTLDDKFTSDDVDSAKAERKPEHIFPPAQVQRPRQ